MSVIDDVIRSYRAPRAVFQRRLSMGTREDKALAVLMGATMLVWIFIMPLAFYLIGTLSHFVMRLVGGRGTAFRARLALFWALLCATPLWLLWGLVAGFIGEGVQMTLTGALALLAFLLFWSINLREAERRVEG